MCARQHERQRHPRRKAHCLRETDHLDLLAAEDVVVATNTRDEDDVPVMTAAQRPQVTSDQG